MSLDGARAALSPADAQFFRRAMREPLLSSEEEASLARAWRNGGDEASLHRLIASHTRLVAAIAARFRAYGLPPADLMQEGCLGLLQAANRFDPERGVRFSTYATWWIRSAVQDYVLRNWSIVRAGNTATQKALFFNLRRLRAKLEKASGRPIGLEGRQEIAATLKVPLADVESMEQRLGFPDRSLNLGLPDSEAEEQDFLADTRAGPEDLVIEMSDGAKRSRWLAEAMRALSERERIIIEQRRLLEVGRTLEDLGRMLGVSKERVRQLESRALGKLRAALAERGGLEP